MSAVICGIDEAGRGPLAGSLFVAGCILTKEVNGLNDSKKLTAKKREALFEEITQNSLYIVVEKSAEEIDSVGVSKCLKSALIKIKESLNADKYIFDGNTTFGVSGIETMIKADTKLKEAMAASILAKVSKDAEAKRLELLYPNYGFASHKGYGTAKHVEAIKRYGLCEAHRKSFKLKGVSMFEREIM